MFPTSTAGVRTCFVYAAAQRVLCVSRRGGKSVVCANECIMVVVLALEHLDLG